MNILEQALNKVSTETLDQMEQGQTIVLNERYEIYSYFDEDYFVIRDTDESVDDEIFCVQYADNNEVVFTDFYGYDEIEQSLTKTI
jgi:translation elongation factor P/translation initiation factor 5A